MIIIHVFMFTIYRERLASPCGSDWEPSAGGEQRPAQVGREEYGEIGNGSSTEPCGTPYYTRGGLYWAARQGLFQIRGNICFSTFLVPSQKSFGTFIPRDDST